MFYKIEFQFPSNGKGFPNTVEEWRLWPPTISFNSLQTGKAFRTRPPMPGRPFTVSIPNSFNSLQTGKAFRTDFPGKVSECPELKFQFPSNGKGFPNEMDVVKMFFRILVSIPFKRERLSEHSQFFHQRLLTRVSIPFKRERLSEQRRPLMVSLRPVKFQFPSNGKGFPNKISVL